MEYHDLLDVMQMRAERLGLVGEDGHSDAAELELYLYQALLDVTEWVDLPQYLHYSAGICQTAFQVQEYPLPEDFGRLILPRVQNRRGIYCIDAAASTDLEYLDPNAFARLPPQTPGRPQQFSVIGRRLWLTPPPDARDTPYLVQGVYVIRVGRPDLHETVDVAYPSVLVDQALWRLATDMKLEVPRLTQSRDEGMQRLAQGSR